MRAFIAVSLSGELSDRLRRLQQALAVQLPEFRPMTWQNLHLTLNFLGNQTTQVLEEVAALMLSIGVQMEPFEAQFRGWKLAGHRGARRPLCLEIAAQPQLLDLQRRLSRGIRDLGIEPERRRYWPHLALGRTRAPLPTKTDLAPLLNSIPQRIRVERIALYRSRLLPGGAEHSLLAETTLEGRRN